jgi:hypothetical protein
MGEPRSQDVAGAAFLPVSAHGFPLPLSSHLRLREVIATTSVQYHAIGIPIGAYLPINGILMIPLMADA